MKFTEYLFEENKELWEQYLVHPFITEIGEGTLPKEKFLNYLIQDYLYLKEFVRVFAMGVVKAKSIEEMKLFSSAIGGSIEDEAATHIKYMEQLGVSIEDAEKCYLKINNRSYVSYMQSISLTGSLKEIVMATLPCTWSYYFIGEYLLENYRDNLLENYYGDWIKSYSGHEFKDVVEKWIDYTNELCSNLTQDEKVSLNTIFNQASIYEMDFWEMAYEDLLEKEMV
ncbi:thiaminase II [Romboutsia sp.]|uniref:thiaminase II n=1 Tax=Romboutsia sp. TaxID=1965302 RepID=UPI003F399602